MNMKEFYEKYNLNKYNFAEMAHVGTRTLIKYSEQKPIRGSARLKIEKAIRVVEENDLVRPRYDYGKGIGSMFYKTEFYIENEAYFKRFEKLLNEEDAQ